MPASACKVCPQFASPGCGVPACICMWALCLPICCVVTGEEIIRSSTGTNNHCLWGSDSAAGAGETRQQSTQREWRKEVDSAAIQPDRNNIANMIHQDQVSAVCALDESERSNRLLAGHWGCASLSCPAKLWPLWVPHQLTRPSPPARTFRWWMVEIILIQSSWFLRP